MAKQRGGDVVYLIGCGECSPILPVSVERAKQRFRHYLNFKRAADLREHLEAQPRQPDPPMGYSFEQWLQGVMEWYTVRKMRERSEEDLARFRDTQVDGWDAP